MTVQKCQQTKLAARRSRSHNYGEWNRDMLIVGTVRAMAFTLGQPVLVANESL